MPQSRIALVTGANQGLGRALVEGLVAAMSAEDRVLLTGRDPDRVAAAAAAVASGPVVAHVEGRVLDVRDGEAITRLAAELGEVDIVFSNATSRMSPDADPIDEVDAVAETNNLAATRILRAFAPRLRPGGRLIIVASALGRSTSSTSGCAAASPRSPNGISMRPTRSSATGVSPSMRAAPRLRVLGRG